MLPHRIACLAVLAACAASATPGPIRLQMSATELTLIAAPGSRINARLKPTIELDNGQMVVFDQGAVDADSAYFVAAPRARFAGPAPASGILRVGVCPAGLSVCQSLEIPLERLLADR